MAYPPHPRCCWKPRWKPCWRWRTVNGGGRWGVWIQRLVLLPGEEGRLCAYSSPPFASPYWMYLDVGHAAFIWIPTPVQIQIACYGGIVPGDGGNAGVSASLKLTEPHYRSEELGGRVRESRGTTRWWGRPSLRTTRTWRVGWCWGVGLRATICPLTTTSSLIKRIWSHCELFRMKACPQRSNKYIS